MCVLVDWKRSPTCSLAADEISCSEKDKGTQVGVKKKQQPKTPTKCATWLLGNKHPRLLCSAHLHEVQAARPLEEHLQGAAEFLRFPPLLLQQQRGLGGLAHARRQRVAEHLRRLGLVGLQQRVHPLVLGPRALLQLRHRGLCREATWETGRDLT